ncbi:MAG: M3 family oligoendopeptidase [Pseudomonadota bacterium]
MMSKAMKNLPRWNLKDLYSAPDGADLLNDKKKALRLAKAFEERYAPKIAILTGKELITALRAYEKLETLCARLGSYAYLFYAQDMSRESASAFVQKTTEDMTQINRHLLFFTLTLARDKPAQRRKRLTASGPYAPFLQKIYDQSQYKLSDELERFINDKTPTGSGAWVRLFDETIARLRFSIGRSHGSLAQVLDRLSHPRADVRKRAAQSLAKGLTAHEPLFVHITNTLAKDKAVTDEWRGFSEPWSARNLANEVEDEVVDALLVAVKRAYGDLSHRYYRFKARWFGKQKLAYWDRNAPYNTKEEVIAWSQAQRTVQQAVADFSPPMAAIQQQFFTQAWIDAEPRAGKAPGAFSASVSTDSHPFILMNYMGKSRDVMTLAHELGHGIHQVLAAKQGELLSHTPLTLAETASVFCETLTFTHLLKKHKDPARRFILLTQKIEDVINTVVRQISFYDFERRVHHARRHQGVLSADQIGQIWLDVQKESLGPAIKLDKSYGIFWTYIPHFIHSPFYVYAYAFGQCLVDSLYDIYESGTIKNFPGKYVDLLKAGGRLRHTELLAPFGLDARSPDFWTRGLRRTGRLIDQLEVLAAEQR